MSSKRLQLDIDAMSCVSCVAHVRSALAILPDVRVEDTVKWIPRRPLRWLA
jgi:copper chaperone CopZ